MNHKKSSLGRSRDFGIEGAGKGDANRVTDRKAYLDNYSAINWSPKPALPQERFVENEAEWTWQNIPDNPTATPRTHDLDPE